MELKFEPIKSQKFDIGRTINFSKCNCEKCDFMHCPKHNYAVKMKRVKHNFKDFWEVNAENLLSLNPIKIIDTNFPEKIILHLTYEQIEDIMDCMNFPKGTYWDVDKSIFDGTIIDIDIQKISTSGYVSTVGIIFIAGKYFNTYDATISQNKLCHKILDFIKEIISKIVSTCISNNQNPLIGWLSPEGHHYVCESYQHCCLADKLGMGEDMLEHCGWVKIVSTDTYLHTKKLTAEQQNWISLNGFDCDKYQSLL